MMIPASVKMRYASQRYSCPFCNDELYHRNRNLRLNKKCPNCKETVIIPNLYDVDEYGVASARGSASIRKRSNRFKNILKNSSDGGLFRFSPRSEEINKDKASIGEFLSKRGVSEIGRTLLRKPIFLILIICACLVSGFLWAERKDFLAKSDSKQAIQVVDEFLQAKTLNQFLSNVRRPDDHIEEIKTQFYQHWQGKIPELKKIAHGKIVEGKKAKYYYCQALFKNGEKHYIAAVKTPLGYKIDWDAFTLKEATPWDEFLKRESEIEREYRVVAKIKAPRKLGKKNYAQEMTIKSPSGKQNADALLFHTSKGARALLDCFKASEDYRKGKLLTVKVKHAPARDLFVAGNKDELNVTGHEKRLVITEFVAEGWVKATN